MVLFGQRKMPCKVFTSRGTIEHIYALVYQIYLLLASSNSHLISGETQWNELLAIVQVFRLKLILVFHILIIIILIIVVSIIQVAE